MSVRVFSRVPTLLLTFAMGAQAQTSRGRPGPRLSNQFDLEAAGAQPVDHVVPVVGPGLIVGGARKRA